MFSRYGASSTGTYYAFCVRGSGYIAPYALHDSNSIRPVFFLDTNIQYVSGSGTLADPFIISWLKIVIFIKNKKHEFLNFRVFLF